MCTGGGNWENLKPNQDDEWPPPLQEHSMVFHNGKLYVFGGEIGMTDEFVTPLWIYSIKVSHKSFKNPMTIVENGFTQFLHVNFVCLFV